MFDTSTPDRAARFGFCHSPAAQLIVRHRCVIEVNEALERLFDFARGELVGCSVQRLYPSAADFKRIGDMCEHVLRQGGGTFYEDERFMQTNKGEIFWARARGTTLTPDDPFALMIWSFDRIDSRQYRSVKLTVREREIANFVVNGLTSRQIGTALGISYQTVEVHRSRLMKKFKVGNTAELVSEIVLAV